MRLSKQSLRRKSLLSHMLTAILVALVFSVTCSFACMYGIRTYYLEQTVSQARAIGVRQSASDWRRRPRFEQIVDNYQRLIGGTIIIADEHESGIVFSLIRIENGNELELPLTPEEAVFHAVDIEDETFIRDAESVLEGRAVDAYRYFPFSERWVVYSGVPVYGSNDDIAYGLFVIKPIKNLNVIWQRLATIIILSFIVSSATAFIVSARYAKRLAEPIVNLTKAADHILEGEALTRSTRYGDDEIERLNVAFDEMNERIDSAMRSMRRERDRLNAIIDGIDYGILAVNRNGAIVHYNEAVLELMELRSYEELLASLKTNPVLVRLFDTVDRVLATGITEEYFWETETKRSIYARVSNVPTHDDNVGVICHLGDVSETMRLEQMRREYIGNISHELRTPLTGIRGLVEPLMDGVVETEEERMEYYRIIDKEARRLEALVGEMLELSRLQSGGASIILENVPLRQPIDTALATMRSSALQAGISLRIEMEDEDAIVQGDEAHIEQVLVILLDNAIDFTPSGGDIVVSTKALNDFVEVSVTDTGSGIEPKDLKYIWERFYKADRTRMKSRGTGLGLPIARGIVELMGGRIEVETEPGRGSRFYFTLRKGA